MLRVGDKQDWYPAGYHADGDIVTADNAGASPLIASRTAIGPWESFDLIHD